MDCLQHLYTQNDCVFMFKRRENESEEETKLFVMANQKQHDAQALTEPA